MLCCIRFLAFIILTMAASISCFLSSSTLLLVSLRSGSDSPFAATVMKYWQATWRLGPIVRNKQPEWTRNEMSNPSGSWLCATLMWMHHLHWTRGCAQSPSLWASWRVFVEQLCPWLATARHVQGLFLEYLSRWLSPASMTTDVTMAFWNERNSEGWRVTRLPRRSTCRGCWTTSKCTSGRWTPGWCASSAPTCDSRNLW